MKKEQFVKNRIVKTIAGAAGMGAMLAMGMAHAGVTTIGKPGVIKLMKEDTGKVTGHNQVTYSGANPHTVIEQVLPGFPFPSFEADKQTNPTLIYGAGVKKVTISVINTNGGAEHSFMITKKGPPYSAMPNPSSLHAMAVVPELPAASGGQFNTDTVEWTPPGPGTYYYLCKTPGHASTGMHGKIVVK
ncbi:hypothetical protein BJI67_01975 [Acidihalobacter aeolianus]|uniref:Rusticyanin n=2 Tax=Acidihalobacter TaxID=1765964 RepID=B2ZFN6_9GAMM|nr:plastocyanin/azurin family copper-binding protein [Acidihalobacter aeolianus]ACD03845.1 Rusticyanin [Acidihalobacter aeolianus]AOV16001.1 hypothetical protein BJI67_01975 [Acidihalobacter aeolianus]